MADPGPGEVLSARNPAVRFVADLVRHAQARSTARRFVVEGPKLVELAISSGRRVDWVFFDSPDSYERFGVLARLAVRTGARLGIVAPGVMKRISGTVSPQGVLAVTEMVEASLADLPASGFVLVCVDVADPGNLGTAIRGAAAAGADGAVVCDGCVDAYNPKAVRASAGALLQFRVITKVPAGPALTRLADLGYRRVGAVARGGVAYDEADFAGPLAFVAGGESRGIPVEVSSLLDCEVTIPMVQGAESLNVAMAATVLCFEAARRRRLGSNARRESELTVGKDLGRRAGKVEPDRSKVTGQVLPGLAHGNGDLDRRLMI